MTSRRKIDHRIKTLIENCVTTNHRAMFVILGEKGVNQVWNKEAEDSAKIL